MTQAEINLKTSEAFEKSKAIFVNDDATYKVAVALIKEIGNVEDEAKALDKKVSERILQKLQNARNFSEKKANKYALTLKSVADKEKLLEEKREENAKKISLEPLKFPTKAEPVVEEEKRKPGRPPKK